MSQAKSIEAEVGLLSGLIVDPQRIPSAVAIVQPTDFADDAIGELFRLVVDMHGSGISVRDEYGLIRNAKQSGLIEKLGGQSSFVQTFVIGMGGTNANVEMYAREIKQESTRRRLAEVANRFVSEIENCDDPEQLSGEIRASIDQVQVDSGVDDDCVTLFEASLQKLDQLTNPQSNSLGTLLATGIECIDETYGGFRSGGLYVLAARPGQGKSALMKQIANACDRRGKPSFLVSLEMEPDEIATRVLSERTGIDSKYLEIDESSECPLSSDQFSQFADAVQESKNSKMIIHAPKGRNATMEAIAARARLMKAKHDIQLLAIDYVQIIAKSHPRQSDYELATSASKACKSLARELGIPILLLSQFNRANETTQRTPRRPRLSDLRDSGAIEQDADGVIAIHRIEDGQPDFDLLVLKWRNDSPGEFKVRLVGELTKFESVAPANYDPGLGKYAGTKIQAEFR